MAQGEMMGGVLKKIRWSLLHRGTLGTVRSAIKSVGRRMRRVEARPMHPFDARHGVDTDGLIVGGDLGAGHRNDIFIAGYAGVPPSRFLGAMERWRASGLRHSPEEYAFYDLGCGKGRAVLLASELGFREVVGVELNTELAAVARANLDIWKAAGRARSPIRVECGDATEVRWPEGPCLIFMYNPFAEPVMREVLKQVRRHFDGRRGDLEVVYLIPEQAHVFEDGFEMVWCEAIAMSEEDRAADLVAGPTDECRAYRLLGR